MAKGLSGNRGRERNEILYPYKTVDDESRSTFQQRMF